MQLKTILNRVQKFKSFVYAGVRWAGSAEAPELEVEVGERAKARRQELMNEPIRRETERLYPHRETEDSADLLVPERIAA